MAKFAIILVIFLLTITSAKAFESLAKYNPNARFIFNKDRWCSLGLTFLCPNNSGSGRPPPNVDQFREDALNAHNRHRRNHCTPDLVTDAALQASAQAYAEKLARSPWEHSPEAQGGQYGENLARFTRGTVTGSSAVDEWYNEIRDYNFQSHTSTGVTGHFTAVIWKASQRVGTGVATKGETYFVVSHYSPPGNVDGQFPANVLSRCR